jgi:hypothetical protein
MMKHPYYRITNSEPGFIGPKQRHSTKKGAPAWARLG